VYSHIECTKIQTTNLWVGIWALYQLSLAASLKQLPPSFTSYSHFGTELNQFCFYLDYQSRVKTLNVKTEE
jgi:hypothetical protein